MKTKDEKAVQARAKVVAEQLKVEIEKLGHIVTINLDKLPFVWAMRDEEEAILINGQESGLQFYHVMSGGSWHRYGTGHLGIHVEGVRNPLSYKTVKPKRSWAEASANNSSKAKVIDPAKVALVAIEYLGLRSQANKEGKESQDFEEQMEAYEADIVGRFPLPKGFRLGADRKGLHVEFTTTDPEAVVALIRALQSHGVPQAEPLEKEDES